jgi:hypothetical protein
MAQSLTLQTSDSDIVESDVLGRLSFAASSEASGSDALLIGAGIYAEAESTFTAISNATSLVLATASSESATGKLKITSNGHLVPLLNNAYDIGSSSFIFRNLYLNSGIFTNLSVTGGSLSINTNGQSSIFSTRYGADSVGFNMWIGNGGASAIGNNLATNWGSYNSSCGISSLLSNTTGFQNCAFGHSSLLSNTTGYYNSAFGQASLQTNIVGVANCAFGINALLANLTNNNSAFGFCSMQSTTTGSNNSALGTTSLFANTTGTNNCAFGADAGRYINSGAVNQTSSTSIYIGNDSRASANGNSNEIVIGSSSRGNGSNTVTIGNSSTTSIFLNGNVVANSIAGNAALNSVVDGRLTISQGNPIPAEIGNNFSNILYFTPFNGNKISLYNTTNSRWEIHTFSEISISLASGYAANTMYDVFIYDNAGTKTLELTAWTTQGGFASPTATASARSSGSVLALQDGVYVKSGSPNKRYLGTARTNETAGVISDGPDQRFLWNMYNRVYKYMSVSDVTTHTYTTATYRIYRNQTSNIVEFITGLDRYTTVNMTIISSAQVNPASSIPVGIGVDITNGINTTAIINNVSIYTLRCGNSDYHTIASAGYHYLAMIEYGATGAGYNNAVISALTTC